MITKFSVELVPGIQDGTSITNYAYVWGKVGVLSRHKLHIGFNFI
jgi:hypothetical protein